MDEGLVLASRHVNFKAVFQKVVCAWTVAPRLCHPAPCLPHVVPVAIQEINGSFSFLSNHGRLIMAALTRIALCVLVLVVAIGCASTEVTKRDSKIGTEKIPRPDRIYVYPFAATPSDIPSWSVSAGRYAESSLPSKPEEIEVGRMIGDLVAKELVTEITEMGLVAYKRSKQSLPRPNDLMIMGYFEAVEEGSTVKRLALGFGSGSTELTTAVEGYQMTKEGPRLLGASELESTGGKTPGIVVPLAVLAATSNPIGLIVVGGAKVAMEMSGKTKIEGAAKQTAEAIADQLRIRFKEQGWIQ
jgi:hypothetical protein